MILEYYIIVESDKRPDKDGYFPAHLESDCGLIVKESDLYAAWDESQYNYALINPNTYLKDEKLIFEITPATIH